MKKYYVDTSIGIEAESKVAASKYVDEMLLLNMDIVHYDITDVEEVEEFEGD